MTIDFGITRKAARKLVDALTPREREVAEQMALGVARVEIARQLGISKKTVDIHLGQVMSKFGVGAGYCIARIWFASIVEG